MKHTIISILLILTLTVTIYAKRPATLTLVTFPSPEVEFIAGPQIASGASTIPGASWFDQNAIDRGLTLCATFPDAAHTPGNILIDGTVSVVNGSTTVIGSNTHFLTQATDYAIMSNGPTAARIIKIIASIQSDTQLTLTLPWEGSTLNGQTISSPTGAAVDNYQGFLNYYDFVKTQYINFYRTGNAQFLTCARKAADSWWSQPVIDNGRNLASAGGNTLAPRSIVLDGLMLRALDGHPEMWPYILDYVSYQYNQWVELRIDYPGFYFGIRDGGFMLLYCTDLAKVHPDATVRASLQARAINGAVNYYARLQNIDGSYRWNDEDFPFTGGEQPFQVGILNEAMIAVHRLTGNAIVAGTITKSATHEFNVSYNPLGWKAVYYVIHGTEGVPPIDCETGCGVASNPFPPSPPLTSSDVFEARQLNATTIHQYGYAYFISNNNQFRMWGDAIFDATYSGTDGFRGLANGNGKNYDEAYRAGARYLAWREGALPAGTGGSKGHGKGHVKGKAVIR